MPGPLVVSDRISIPEGELRWRFSRSGGPGGQSVNTADSRVELLFDLAASPSLPVSLRDRAVHRLGGRLVDGVVTVTAEEHRSQLRNRESALRRLAELLRDAMAPPPPKRRPTRPTRGSQVRRLDGKRKAGDTKKLRRPPPVE
jgi:ribosome-associated protein